MEKIEIRPVGLEAEAVVQAIFEKAPDYFLRVDGCAVQPHFAKKEITDRPQKTSDSYEKCFCLIYGNGQLVGVAGLHKDHPEKGTVYIGLLLIPEKLQGEGLGRKIYATIGKFARKRLKAEKIRLGVSEANNVEGFWLKMGFQRNNKTFVWKGEAKETTVFEMEKKI